MSLDGLAAEHIAWTCEELHGLNPHYIQTLQSELRGLLRRLGRADLCQCIPAARGTLPREVTVPEVEFWATIAKAGPALELAMLIAHDAALRLGTICALTPDSLDWDAKTISGRTKRQNAFCVPMTTRLQERLSWAAAQCKSRDMTLLGSYRASPKPYRIDAIEVQLRRAKTQARAGPWCFHDIRRTAARRLFDQTHDVRKVQRLLGHMHLRTSLWYLGNLSTELSVAELDMATQMRKPERIQTNGGKESASGGSGE